MLPSCCPWQQDLQRPMNPALIESSLAGVRLLGANSMHHSPAPSSVPSSAADSFSDFGTFICQGVFQSCIRELGAIQCLFHLISVFQDRYHCLQCKAHPANEKLGAVQPRSKIRAQEEDELTCRAHCFETFVLHVFSFCIQSSLIISGCQEAQHLCSQQHEQHAPVRKHCKKQYLPSDLNSPA